MSKRVYSDGILVEEWNDDEAVYRSFEDGELLEERAYTANEAAPIVDRETEAARETTLQNLRDQLAAGVAKIQYARTAAQDDKVKAETLRTQALEALAATVAQRKAVDAFTPATAYSATQLGQVRNAIADALTRIEGIQQALADSYAYRAAVDANAVITDDALLWLARLASGVLDSPPEGGNVQ